MNNERLRELADYIEKLPEDSFDQRVFTHYCGTPACIAGHACTLYDPRLELSRLNTVSVQPLTSLDKINLGKEYSRLCTRTEDYVEVVEAVAQNELGLNQKETEWLFAGCPEWALDPMQPTRQDAVKELRALSSGLSKYFAKQYIYGEEVETP